VTLVTYVTLDLNQPDIGIITVSQEPFERLLQSMGCDVAPPTSLSSKGPASP
jgi:hypothetical protein